MEKIQKAKIGVAGNLINQIMSNNCSLPEVGKGATIMHYSDRSVAEVIEVSKDGKTVILESMTPTHYTDGGEYADEFELTGNRFTVIWRQGCWRSVSTSIKFTKEFIQKVWDEHHTEYIALALSKYYPELHQKVYKGEVWPQEVVEGVTKEHKIYNKINILFGRRDFRYDLSF